MSRSAARGAARYGPDAADASPGTTPASAIAVHALTTAARDLVEGAFPPLWVRGEVTGFKEHRNGHWYFSLRDAEAQVRCVVWQSQARRMPAAPDEGMQVVALGQMTVWPVRADLQFVVTALDADGEGLWRKALEQTRQRLEADGLLDPARKRALPLLPRTVAVITSPDGAALHDIVTVAQRRHPGVRLVLSGAQVQGDGAAESLIAALDRVVRWGQADVVIIGRGGGSREDLWAFNDERLARAIAASPIPVVSAVGHETDVSISDLVADLRAATPSAAAEAVVPDRAALEARLAALQRHLAGALQRRQLRAAARLDAARRRVVAAGKHRQLRVASRLEAVRRRLVALAERRALLAAGRLERVAQRLAATSRRRQAAARARVETLAGRLDALSPLAVLARGYAVARDAGGANLSSVGEFPAGRPFELWIRDGIVDATAVGHRPRPDRSPPDRPATEDGAPTPRPPAVPSDVPSDVPTAESPPDA